MKINTALIAKLIFFCFVLLKTRTTQANNISVSNISITGKNTTAGVNNATNYSMVKFNLAWENSWRSAALNWDAAWVFVKYRVNGGAWNHCNLNNTGHTAATGSAIDAGLVTPSSAFNVTTNPAVGVFIYKNADGNGNVNYQNVQLRWNYGSQGVADNAVLDVQVFAIEMVYVPTGTFAFGDGLNYPITTINTGNATTAPSGIGSLGGQAGGYPTGQTAPSSPDFPNGYKAFYCMKYEISQGQYVDFLNTLTYNQQISRTFNDIYQPITQVGSYALVDYYAINNGMTGGNDIRVIIGASNNTIPAFFNSSNKELACNFLNEIHLASVLDWCGLRPMTELEYEKNSRGSVSSFPNETVWGTTAIDTIWQGLSCYISPDRVGGLASQNSNRVTSKATYYGVLEMGDNLLEFVSNSSSANNSTHGDGILDNLGNTTNSWGLSGLVKGLPAFDIYGHAKLGVISIKADESIGRCGFGGRGVRSAQ